MFKKEKQKTQQKLLRCLPLLQDNHFVSVSRKIALRRDRESFFTFLVPQVKCTILIFTELLQWQQTAFKLALISFIVKRVLLLPQAVRCNSSISREHNAEHVLLVLAPRTTLAATVLLAKKLIVL